MINMALERERFRSADPFWASNLIASLEDDDLGSAFTWVSSVIANTADSTCDEALSRLLIKVACLAFDDLNDIDSIALAIWSTRESDAYKATSHLCIAKAHLLSDNQPMYRTHLIKAMMFIGNEIRKTDAGFDEIEKAFNSSISR